ncbi:MAG: hypothetical protein JW941_00425 [Candidatus Coatesbacteria bacterium]|nr:hypothetical protein [Candidatus Coatesbacteria bacterium]
MLSQLSEHLSEEQIQQSLLAAAQVTGISLPTTDPEMIEALLNRAEAFCLEILQNDWLPRFDLDYGGDSLSRSNVARQIERKLARLSRRWAALSRRYRPDADLGSRRLSIGTANRV